MVKLSSQWNQSFPIYESLISILNIGLNCCCCSDLIRYRVFLKHLYQMTFENIQPQGVIAQNKLIILLTHYFQIIFNNWTVLYKSNFPNMISNSSASDLLYLGKVWYYTLYLTNIKLTDRLEEIDRFLL